MHILSCLIFQLLSELNSFPFALLSPGRLQKPQPSTTTFVLNQLNQLPSLGTIVVTKPSVGPGTTSRQTLTVAKVINTSSTTVRANSTAATCEVVPSCKDQIQLKDLLKTSSLGELMKLKPPPNIAQPVATATSKFIWIGCSFFQASCFVGVS